MVFPAAAAKSLQLCLTLCDPIDGLLPGSSVPGILHARTLEWVAISFSSAWKSKVKVKSLSHVQLLATSWTAAYQAPPSMGFSRQEYWSGVPLPSPGGFPYFLQFKSEFDNKEFMIWATVSSQSYFCWLCRASPSLVAKNIINLISVLTTCWCPCVEFSLVLLKEGVCYDQCSPLAKTLLAFALLWFVLQAQIYLLFQVTLDFLLLHSSPL